MAAAELETQTKQNPSVTLPSKELSRLLKIFIAKGGGGAPPFQSVRFSRTPEALIAEYQAPPPKSVGIFASYPLPGSGPNEIGDIATNDPVRLLEYIDGIAGLADDQAITLSSTGDWIRIRGGRRNATMSAVDPESVPRTQFQNPYGMSPGGVVSTNPNTRPPAGSPWDAWTANGYAVYQIKKSVLADILTGGALIAKRYKNALIRVTGDQKVVAVTIQESQDQTADSIDLGILDGVTVYAGSPPVDIHIRYDLVEPLWNAIQTVKTDHVWFVHRPIMFHGEQPEVRFNVLAQEESGLQLTQICAIQLIEP
jgi:hypothetical protein